MIRQQFMKFPFYSRTFVPTIALLRGRKEYYYLRQIAQNLYLPYDRIRLLQSLHLRRLVNHCYENVTYYRNLFDSLSLKPEDIKDPEDLEKLPILTKQEIRENKQDLIAANFPRSKLRPKMTSGSDGKPLDFFRHDEYFQMGRAGTMRNMSLCGWTPGDTEAIFWGFARKQGTKSSRVTSIRHLLNSTLYFNAFNQSEREMAKWVGIFIKYRPSVIYGYASSIYLFAKFLQDKNNALSGIKGIFSTCEKLYDFQRKVLKEVFACPVYDLYGSSEILNIAFECNQGNMHISSDFVVLEQLQEPGLPDPVFVVTSLHNRAMPFLRYRLGDCGQILDTTCTCGINTPLIDLNITRSTDYLVTPKTQIHGGFFEQLVEGVKGIKIFQVHQTSLSEVRLYIVKDRDFGERSEKQLEDVICRMEGNIGKIRIHPIFVDHVEQMKSGKYRIVRSDVGQTFNE